ncbi:hypothetical protein BGZ49_003591 [Haplosporangium sp. Z 27]|nr:hypothetical protein BGZ49_003591 [Haplosporangium sp. Z 27]
MTPSNADFDRTSALSDYTVLPTGTSTITKDQDKSVKIRDLIQNQSLEMDQSMEMNQSTPPPKQQNLVSGHKSNDESIVSISAASAHSIRSSNNNNNESGGEHGLGAAPSVLFPLQDKSAIHEPSRDDGHHSLHDHRSKSGYLPITDSPFTVVNNSRHEHEGDEEGIDNDDNEGSNADIEFHEEYNDQLSEEKYKRIKRKLKQALEENGRMSQELDKSNRRIRNLRREKTLLLDRLCTLERRDSESESGSLSPLSSDSDSSDSSALEEIQSKRVSPSGTSRKAKHGRNTSHTTTNQSDKSITKLSATSSASGVTRAIGTKETKSQTVISTPSTITNVGSATQKPKRIHQTNKQRPGLSKIRKVQALERDEAGNIKLPVTVGIITILSIGHVVHDREAFHNDRYIWPVGYKMSRSYNSMIDPNSQTTYTCSVIDDGEAPKFQIDAEDQPGKPIIAGTATGAWTHVVKAANAIRKRDHSNSASGPDYYGFSNATIAKMIQDLPGVEKCQSYVMQRFEGPSASASAKGGSSVAGGDKRKASALSSNTNHGEEGHPRNEDGQNVGEIGQNDDDDDDAYASLGTPGKKKSRISSPKIRHAGFEAPNVNFVGKVEPSHANALQIRPEDDVISHEPDNDSQDLSLQKAKSPSAPLHSITAIGGSQQPVIATATLGDSELIDIEDHDSEVDVGMDEDFSIQEHDTLSSSSPKIPNIHNPSEDEEMTIRDDTLAHN